MTQLQKIRKRGSVIKDGVDLVLAEDLLGRVNSLFKDKTLPVNGETLELAVDINKFVKRNETSKKNRFSSEQD